MSVRDAVRIRRLARLGWFRRGIDHLAGRSLHGLSGGQRERAQLAQLFAQQPDLYLLEQSFSGLGLPTQEEFQRILIEERARGAAMVIATHELAIARGSDLVLLLQGRVIAAGPPTRCAQSHISWRGSACSARRSAAPPPNCCR